MNIIGISGSLRQASFNSLLLKAAAEVAKNQGAVFEIFDLSELPLYNSDLDGDVKPAAVSRLLAAITQADGIFFATPEYNYSIPGVLKNAIDWASRPAYQSVLAGKPSGIVSASMSPLGGARAQVHLRDVLAGTLTPVLLSPDYLLPLAQQAFDSSGVLCDSKAQERLSRYVASYIAWASQH
ncbi:NADPH-dependent FMN reductase [Dasania marina]|uniref:NADPH-dependent FMN reductase n=1 Tax=Dasania marina TaxID=471499 RepID=UPI00037272DD|nr:NADPH-dependent FMN reductase [Dasania marina]